MRHLHLITIPDTRQLRHERVCVFVYELAKLANPSQHRTLIHLNTIELSYVLSHLPQRSALVVQVKRKRNDLWVEPTLEKALKSKT